MSLSKPARASLAMIVVLCMLFTQIATAAYSCPQSLMSAVAQRGEALPSMTDCDLLRGGQMDQGQPNLCKAHCEIGQQSHESKSLVDISPAAFDVLWSLIWILTPTRETVDLLFVAIVAPYRPPGSPAIFLVNQVFRL